MEKLFTVQEAIEIQEALEVNAELLYDTYEDDLPLHPFELARFRHSHAALEKIIREYSLKPSETVVSVTSRALYEQYKKQYNWE